MSEEDCFSTSYTEARVRFREAAVESGAQLASYPVLASSHEDLSIDVAVLGNRSSESAVVISSGCHGVEGFFGSAVQLSCLKNLLHQRTTLNHRLVLVHAINPYGFQTLRRCNEDNVDLNRNFLVDPERYEGAPSGYVELEPFLNPKTEPSSLDLFLLRAIGTVLRRGMPAVKDSVARGQYEFPRGIFFGGNEACQSTRILRQHFESWIGSAGDVVHIDLHSGLGASGRYKMLLIDKKGTEIFQWFSNLFGQTNVEPPDKPDVAYSIKGIVGDGIRHVIPSRRYRFAVAEFGTYNLIRVLGSIRRENQAHFYSAPGSPVFQNAKAELLECFCPASPKWRSLVVAGGMEIISTILAAGTRSLSDNGK